MSRPDADLHAQLVAAIAASGRSQKRATPAGVNRARFLRAYFGQSGIDALSDAPRTLAAAALGHLAFADKRRRGEARVRAFNPVPERDGYASTHTVVETVNDDMPFLVDSLTMALNALGHPVQTTIHPVLDVERARGGAIGAVAPASAESGATAESWIHFEIPRETSARVHERIERRLKTVLASVRAAVEDWRAMLEALETAAGELRASAGIDAALAEECRAFLRWLADDHFTLLGYREYELTRGRSSDELVARAGSGLGILRNEDKEPDRLTLTGRTRTEARSPYPLIITKANQKSTVHRPALLDHISVKVFDAKGRPTVERRFLGLLTSVAYSESPRDIPLLRMKVRQIMAASGLDPRSHRGKALQHILDTFPRDDLIQGGVEELSEIARGVLALEERHQVRLFCRRDLFGRFWSCIVYLPREQYNSDARRRIEALLTESLDGELVDAQPTISESALARLEVVLRTEPGANRSPDVEALRAEIEEAVRSWEDRLREHLLETRSEDEALSLLHDFADAFSEAYKESHRAERANRDIGLLSELASGAASIAMALDPLADEPARMRFTTAVRDAPIPLHRAMPILHGMGVELVATDNYRVGLAEGFAWIQDFDIELPAGLVVDAAAGGRFRQCFASVLAGLAENDGFNAFVLGAGLEWREAALLRAYSKYILQTRIRFSQSYMQEVLGRYPLLCRALLDELAARFDPDLTAAQRERRLSAGRETLARELERVVSLDDDRILRAFTAAVGATLRTNFYQREDDAPKTWISLKLDPREIPELPKPRPMFEIFVYAQRVEGVHLRGGRVARGGIRWSDRREDFRTEVLGLMKAQQVKNTVIVPDGAKGGFVCKALPEGDREAVQAEVVACYRTFIRGLLDVTDNIVDGRVVRPERVLSRDEPDPYLVVAADKGTATFSDTANALARSYAFWLDDAFASGGSAGYDHKKMAITARGAWESVKRHFRELGLDTQTQAFTVVGIGDMSGDVFGNGMLLSETIRLVAAFDHRHIFIDPDPDAAASFAERTRLFELPRSSWDDYDRSKLSEGGGVYSRAAKSITLHAAAQKALGLGTATLTPPELIRAILCARVDLLWNGGIGTYVKSSREAHVAAGDPVNEAVRVDAAELGCRVVGEGGNLGFTQAARIEFALAGGRINTDFIDNSGGVDSSDREVNIKILLLDAIEAGRLARARRDALLARMTDDVAERVLASNYGQTQALSLLASRGRERLGEYARLIRLLEQAGLVDRRLEGLPGDDEIEERRTRGQALTRPELAIVLSYAKIQLTGQLASSDLGDDAYFESELVAYFPRELARRYRDLIPRHRLAREIVAMLVSSSMINRMGPHFALRAEEETGASPSLVARAYMVVRDVFGTRAVWQEIEALDLAVPADVQYDAMFQVSRMLRRGVYWLLRRHRERIDVDACAASLRPGVGKLLKALPAVLNDRSRARFDEHVTSYEMLGLPKSVARRIATFYGLTQILDIVELAGARGLEVEPVAGLYFELGQGLKLDWIREETERLPVDGRWSALARAALRESLAEEQNGLVAAILDDAGAGELRAALAAWMETASERIGRAQRAIADMQTGGRVDFATLSVAVREIGRLGQSRAG